VVAKKIPDALVLGPTRWFFLERDILGSRRDFSEARAMLAKLQGQTHQS